MNEDQIVLDSDQIHIPNVLPPDGAQDAPIDVLSALTDPAYLGLLLAVWLLTEALGKALGESPFRARIMPLVPTILSFALVIPIHGLSTHSAILAVVFGAASVHGHSLLKGFGYRTPTIPRLPDAP